jgi:hypothetical protein
MGVGHDGSVLTASIKRRRESGHHRANGTGRNLRDLTIIGPLNIAQRQDFTKLRWQPRDSRFDGERWSTPTRVNWFRQKWRLPEKARNIGLSQAPFYSSIQQK